MADQVLVGPGDEVTWGPVTDPRDPRYDDPYGEFDLMTQGEVEEQIADRFLATPDIVGDWLAKCCETRGQVSIRYDTPVEDLDVAELLAAVMTGHDRQVLSAVRRLREQFIDAHRSEINADARELWQSQFIKEEA